MKQIIHITLLTYSTCAYVLLLTMPLFSMDLSNFKKERDPREIERQKHQEYLRIKKILAPMGYALEKEEHGRSEPKFTPIARSQKDREALHSWGFTDQDIDELTIRNIHDPLNDERIRQAHRPDLGHPVYPYSFRLFASRLLWPDAPSEADMLLLIPVLRRIDSTGADVNIRIHGRTLFYLAVERNYERVVRLLINDPAVYPDTIAGAANHSNEHDPEKFTTLEVALIRNRHLSLLNSPIAEMILNTRAGIGAITDRLRTKAKHNTHINELISTCERKEQAGELMELSAESGGFIPARAFTSDALIKKYAKKHADLIRAAEKNNEPYPSQPPHSRIKPFIAWALGVPVVAAIAKGAHEIYTKYYRTENKDSQTKRIN